MTQPGITPPGMTPPGMTPPGMTPLAALIARRIRANGPITVADYMAECLLHPTHGYYTTRNPFGAAGDFVTAPEISQMFGELMGLALAQAWLDQGAPVRFTLAELGPGRGTLMADALRATRAVPGFHAAASVMLVEASAHLRAVQAATLSRAGHPGAAWTDTIDALPEAPLFLLANEFFDALPIRQVLRSADGWRERMVGLAGEALAFGLSGPMTPPPSPGAALGVARPGDLVELCPAATPVMARIGALLRAHGGAALVIDYGARVSKGDTLQALRDHAFDDPLAHPGLADLTAHVDFDALAAAAGVPHVLATQGAVLARLGLHARADRLAAGLSGAALTSHRAAERRLTHPEEMGNLFKVLALAPPLAPLPPGFA